MNKDFFLRMGSNSEKNYIYKTASLFTGILIKANYFESASGLLSGLFLKLTKLNLNNQFHIIDPISYVFGLDPENEWSIRSWQKVKNDEAITKLKDNLCIPENEEVPPLWIKEIENPNENQVDKVEAKLLKKAFRKLADIYFKDIESIRTSVGKKEISSDDFDANSINIFVKNTINYQETLLEKYYSSEKYSNFDFPTPKFILSPYFHIDNEAKYNFMIQIWNSFSEQYTQENGSLVLLSTKDFFINNYEKLTNYFSSSKTNNIFFWIDDFDEYSADSNEIDSYVNFIIKLSNSGKNTFNLYSGGFSNLLLPFGLTGIINGPGYGLDRKIEPVQGGLPSAQYYIPSLRTRETVFNAYDLITKNELGKSKNEFHDQVCNCPICKNGIKSNANDMLSFYGEFSNPKKCADGRPRKFPSKEALERTTFHFILSRLLDFKKLSSFTKNDVLEYLSDSITIWKNTNTQLVEWKSILEKYI